MAQGLEREARRRSCSPTAPTRWTPRPAHAAGLLHGPERPADARDAGRDPPARRTQGGLVADGLVYRYDPQRGPGRPAGRRGDVQHVHVLAGRGADPRRAHRPGAPRRGPAALRADARLRQPPRAVRRADRPERRGAGQLPAGVHAPGADQRRLQPRPGAGRGRPRPDGRAIVSTTLRRACQRRGPRLRDKSGARGRPGGLDVIPAARTRTGRRAPRPSSGGSGRRPAAPCRAGPRSSRPGRRP